MKFPVVHILIFGILTASCPAADIEVVDSYTTLTGELENVPEEVPAEILRSIIDPADLNNYHNNVKKIVDFGLSRGFSGIKLAKHLMALQVARYASGPGRKRRSVFPVKKRHQN